MSTTPSSPIYPAYTFTGELAFFRRCAYPDLMARLDQSGVGFTLPSGKETVLIKYRTRPIYAPNRRDAYNVLRQMVAAASIKLRRHLVLGEDDLPVGYETQSFFSGDEAPVLPADGSLLENQFDANPSDTTYEWHDSGRLFIHSAHTTGWSRGDLVFGYGQQLLLFNPEERANPDVIVAAVQGNTDIHVQSAARRRRVKLRRVLGMQSFVNAHPNLNIVERDPRSPLARVFLEGGVIITYSTTRNRIHFRHHQSGLDLWLVPTDAPAFNSALAHAGAVAGMAYAEHQPWVPPAISAELAAARSAWNTARELAREIWAQENPYPSNQQHVALIEDVDLPF